MNKFYLISFGLLLMILFFMVIFFTLVYSDFSYLIELVMMSFNSIEFKFIVYIDWMSMIFGSLVLFISSMVIIYSKAYLGEVCLRFLWLTFFFVLFMLLMILSPSILGVILGWDGLGLISYCLVIYYQSKSSFNSGFITAASNRLGDSFLILSIVLMSLSGNFLFWEILNFWGIISFFLACLTKSAQFPFSAWLPLAMSAPTPISSLVHSSTLVTAGVYLCIRFSYSIHIMNMSIFMFMISSFTIIMASLSSFFEYDLKRIIAFSTLSQLGFMMFLLSMGYSFISFFHLLIHALFKALLFLCSGSYIFSGQSIQDLRKMGGMNINLLMKFSLIISSFSLMGVPFSSGFYSKDLMLEFTYMNWGGVGLGFLMILCSVMTISYTIRIIKYMNLNYIWVVWVEPSSILILPILCVSFMNIFLGCMLNWLLFNIYFICVDFEFKMSIILILLLSLIWQGELSFYTEFSFYYSMMWIMSISKGLGKLILLISLVFKSMDQGWMEYNLMYMSYYFKTLSFWFMNVFFKNYVYLNSVGFLIYFMLMF